MRETALDLMLEYDRAKAAEQQAIEALNRARLRRTAAESRLKDFMKAKRCTALTDGRNVVRVDNNFLWVMPVAWAHEMVADLSDGPAGGVSVIPSEAATGSEFPDEAEVRANDLAHLAGHPLAQTARQCCPEEVP